MLLPALALPLLLLGSEPTPAASVRPLGPEVREQMRGVSWREGCPVGLDELRLVTVPYRDREGATRLGELVVHHSVADEVGEIFAALHQEGFVIERMERIERYGGSDDKSMAANNTSAFNCRPVTGRPGVFSRHSYGVAIDVNPLPNPYVRGDTVEPAAGRAFLDRESPSPMLITADGPVVKTFTARGWSWGGSWRSLKDYQHFEKPRPAAKRPRG